MPRSEPTGAPPIPDEAYVDRLRALGHEHGLDRVGVAPATVLDRARRALCERRAQGLHDTMQFTYRDPERATDPGRVVRDARSVVVAARSYTLAAPEPIAGPAGRVARYAWVDHYAELRAGLWAIARQLRADGWKAVPVADDNGMVDREIAQRAGLGWFGKSSNLLLPGAGSWFVLGSVVTTAPLPAASEPVPDGCGTCHRCLDACPTGAIVAPGVVDAGRCLAWLLQKPGPFPRQHRVALGDRIYGCDDCQEVCPPTVRHGEVDAHRPPAGADVQAQVSLLDLLAADDDTLLERHGRWYLWAREPRWWRRNALLALGNVGELDDPRVAEAVARHLAHPDPVLRGAAVWAAARLGRRDLLPADDPDPQVRDELAAAPAVAARGAGVR